MKHHRILLGHRFFDGRLHLRRSAVIALVLMAGTKSGAQSSASQDLAAAQSSAQQPMVVMNPFDVSESQNKGYESTTSDQLTRLATPIFDLPVSTQIINSELIHDLDLRSLYDLGGLLVGGVSEGTSTPIGAMLLTMRAIAGAATDDALRDGFRFGAPLDLYNVETVEIVRGPNSATFGASNPGGQVNFITKSAIEGRNFENLDFAAGSYGLIRSALDVNDSFTIDHRPFAIRVNATIDDSDSFIKFVKTDYTGVAGALRGDITPKTSVVVKFEYLQQDGNPPSSLPDRWSGAPGLNPNGGFDYLLNREVPQLYHYDEGNALDGPDAFNDWTDTYGLAEITQNFSKDLTLRLQWETSNEVENTQVSGSTAPGLGYNATTNSYYDTQSWIWSVIYDQRWSTHDFASYDLDLGWTDQKILAGYNFLHVEFNTIYDYLWNSVSNAQVSYRVPLGPGLVTAQNYAIPALSTWYWLAKTPAGDDVNDQSYFINSTGSYLNDRIETVLGWSYNLSTRSDYIFAVPTGGSYRAGTVSPTPKLGTEVGRYIANTPMASVVFKLTPQLNLYVDYSKSFEPQTTYAPTINLQTGAIGASLPPETGEGKEAGIKFNLLNSTLSGSLCAYSFVEGNLNQVINTNIIAVLTNNPLSTQRYYTPGVDGTSKGIELQLFYNPTRNWTFSLDYAYNEAWISSDPAQPQLLGMVINDHADHIGHAQTKYQFPNGLLSHWFVGASVDAHSVCYVYQAPEQGFDPGYAIWGAFVGYSGKTNYCNYTLEARVDNLFNKEYEYGYAILGPPATLTVSASLKF